MSSATLALLAVMSLPAGERGLKSNTQYQCCECGKVAPRRGAWIEIIEKSSFFIFLFLVAPRRGAWIEIYSLAIFYPYQARRSPQGSVD